MFISLFNTLRATGIPCTLRELLDLIAAVDKNLGFADMEKFYFLSRAILVKDEKHYDKFDKAEWFGVTSKVFTLEVEAKTGSRVTKISMAFERLYPNSKKWKGALNRSYRILSIFTK